MTAHPTAAQALETTTVCEIPFASLIKMAQSIPSLYRQVLNRMSKQIRNEGEHALLLGTKSTEQRLATLLIDFSDRFSERGFSAHEFNLQMSRRDIGNFIGTAMETVSRLFSRLQILGFIEVEGKLIRILDVEGLRQYAMQCAELTALRAAPRLNSKPALSATA